MLDAFIIEELKRRERMRQDRDREQPQLPVPDQEDRPVRRTERETEKPQRGVVVIDF